MNHSFRTRLASIAFVSVLAAGLANCGGGDITFGGGGGSNGGKVTFKGNLDSVSPVTTRDIVAFVYQVDDSFDSCPCAVRPADFTALVGKGVVLASGEFEFSMSGLEPGRFIVVFLQDNAGTSADGEINDGDPIAILEDPDCELDDVRADITVTLTDVDILFSTGTAADCEGSTSVPPLAGRARARLITQATTTTSK